MSSVVLKAEERKLTGRKVKQLRKSGVLPANVYGKNVKSLSVQVDLKDFQKTFKEVGETGLVELRVGKENKPVLIHNTQLDPVTDEFVHADFLQVNLKEKVTSQVPVEFVGESLAEKDLGATVVKYVDEIEVEALPMDLPEKFEVDISSLKELDSTITVKDLKVDSKVEIQNDPEQIIAKAEPPREEEEEPVVEGTEEQQEETESEASPENEGSEQTEGSDKTE